jgi:hypothetical protein
MDEARAMIGLKPVGNGLGGSFMVPLNSYLTADPLDLATRPQGGGPAKPDDEGAGEDSPPAAPPKPPKKGLTRRQRAGLLRRAMATIRAMATRPVTLQLQQGDVHVAPAQAFFQPELRAELALPPQPAPVVQVDNHVNVDAPEPRPWDATVTRDGDGRMTSVTHTPARG